MRLRRPLPATWVSLALASAALLPLMPTAEANCIWYGECGLNPDNGKSLNCAYNGTAKPVADSYAEGRFAQLCPHMAEGREEGEDLNLCCSADQILSMEDSFFLISALLGRCPSCLYNFRKVFCEMACSPDQGNYISVTKSLPQNASVINEAGAPLVTGVEFRVGKNFIYGVYDSCKDVVNPSTSSSVFGLLCGPWGDLCTPQRLLAFLGDTGNGNTPFDVDFQLYEEEDEATPKERVYDPSFVQCHVAPPKHDAGGADLFSGYAIGGGGGGGDGACSCTDCEAACTPPDFTEYVKRNDDFEVTYGASVGAVFVLGLLALAAAFVWMRKRKVHPISSGGNSKRFGRWWNRSLLPVMPVQEALFEKVGWFCAHFPLWTLLLAAAVAVACASGIHKTKVTTDPIELWSAKTSEARIEMDTYQDTFGRFFRIEQIIITPKPSDELKPIPYTDLLEEEKVFSPIFNRKFMMEVLRFQKEVEGVISKANNVTFKDVCHQPLAPDNDVCNVQTVWAYWQDDPAELDKSGVNEKTGHNDTYLDHLLLCARNPLLQRAPTTMAQGCMSKGGIPVQPFFALGGVDSEDGENNNFHNASAFVLTILLDPAPEKEEAANEWEEALTAFVQRWSDTDRPEFMDVAFNTERSIQDEIERSSFGDIHIVIASYAVMILYIVFSLGRVSSCATMPVEIKVTLSIFGTFLVLVSIASAVGVYGYIGVQTTLIVFQILPFLVLAVGVDNIFILVNTLERVHFGSSSFSPPSPEESVIRTTGMVGPSMLMSTAAQATAFFLGALSNMPAVRAFSLYAALSLVFNFLFQITALVSVMSLDLKRMLKGKMDVLCCLSGVKEDNDEDSKAGAAAMKHNLEGPLQRAFSQYYTPFLFHPWTKRAVLVIFFAWACLSAFLIPKLHVGLETESALPDDSTVRKYIITLKEHMSVGPPVYFVLNSTGPGFDYSDPKVQNRICGGQGCNPDSVNAQIKLWSKEPRVTYIAAPSQSWIDDYFDWSRSCCKKTEDEQFCPKDDEEDEYGDYGEYGEYGELDEDGNEVVSDEPKCVPCLGVEKRPQGQKFRQAIPWFTQENPSLACPKAGKAAYKNAIRMEPFRGESNSSNVEQFNVRASAFFTFHSVLKTSLDFAESMRWARRLSANLTEMLNQGFEEPQVRVFPYSLFYVFYEQYLTIWSDAGRALGICLAAVFAVVTLLTGVNLFSAAVTLVVVLLTLVNIAGAMYILGISLNAISLVNLVMAVGISIEFCSHLVAAFCDCGDDGGGATDDRENGGSTRPATSSNGGSSQRPPPPAAAAEETREHRARRILDDWGPVLLAGVHVTNLLGVSVLVFARSPVFNIYYFRMYMAVVLTGAAHGLVLLPVLLATFGP